MITHNNAEQMEVCHLAEIEALRKALKAETALKEYYEEQTKKLNAEIAKQMEPYILDTLRRA